MNKIGFIYQHRAVAYIKSGKYRETLVDAKEMIRANPKDILGHLYAGIAFMFLNNNSSSSDSMHTSLKYISQLKSVVVEIKSSLQACHGIQVRLSFRVCLSFAVNFFHSFLARFTVFRIFAILSIPKTSPIGEKILPGR